MTGGVADDQVLDSRLQCKGLAEPFYDHRRIDRMAEAGILQITQEPVDLLSIVMQVAESLFPGVAAE